YKGAQSRKAACQNAGERIDQGAVEVQKNGASHDPKIAAKSKRVQVRFLMRHHLDLAVDAVDDVEGTLVDLAFVLGDGAVFAFRQHDLGEGADRFLDDVAAGRQHRPRGVG